MEIAGGQNDTLVQAAARRAREVVQEVSQGLEQAPGVKPGQVIDQYTMQDNYGGRLQDVTENFTCLGGNTVTHEKVTDRNGQVTKQTLEHYHEGLTDAGDHCELLSMSRRHIPAVVSRLCGVAGALGLAFQPQDSVQYMRRNDRWDGVHLMAHRTTEKVRIYPEGALYQRKDDQDHVKVFLPGFKAEPAGHVGPSVSALDADQGFRRHHLDP